MVRAGPGPTTACRYKARCVSSLSIDRSIYSVQSARLLQLLTPRRRRNVSVMEYYCGQLLQR